MKTIEFELQELRELLKRWGFISIELERLIKRSDGADMLYLKAQTKSHYLHVEGMIRRGGFNFYAKLSKSPRNKHSHREEIIGWDNLYNNRPHIHFDEDRKREWRIENVKWDEIKEMIIRLEEEG